MDTFATAKYVRVGQRKMALLATSIRGMSAESSVQRLLFIKKSGALELSRLIASALANAKNKNLDTGSLVVGSIEVLPGGAMKRFRAVSRGMAHTYKKRMSHIRVILQEKPDKEAKQTTKNEGKMKKI